MLDYKSIKQRATLENVLQHYGVLQTLTGRGPIRRGCCPLHRGSNPGQFVADFNKQLWRCFSPECNREGDAIAFVAEREQITAAAATRLLMKLFSIPTTRRP